MANGLIFIACRRGESFDLSGEFRAVDVGGDRGPLLGACLTVADLDVGRFGFVDASGQGCVSGPDIFGVYLSMMDALMVKVCSPSGREFMSCSSNVIFIEEVSVSAFQA